MSKKTNKNKPFGSSISKKNFQKVVMSVTDIKSAYEVGLKAMNGNSSLINVKSTCLIDGSVDIDKAVCLLYPNDSRWDYVLSYDGKAYYIEVHPAYTGEVKCLIAKKRWLLNWLQTKAQPLNNYPSATPRLYWLQSGKGALLKNTPEYRQAAIEGLIPRAALSI